MISGSTKAALEAPHDKTVDEGFVVDNAKKKAAAVGQVSSSMIHI